MKGGHCARLSVHPTVFYWNWSSKLWLSRQALKSHKHSSTHADRSLQGEETLIHTAPSLTTGQRYLRASPPYRNSIKLSTGLQYSTFMYELIVIIGTVKFTLCFSCCTLEQTVCRQLHVLVSDGQSRTTRELKTHKGWCLIAWQWFSLPASQPSHSWCPRLCTCLYVRVSGSAWPKSYFWPPANSNNWGNSYCISPQTLCNQLHLICN